MNTDGRGQKERKRCVSVPNWLLEVSDLGTPSGLHMPAGARWAEVAWRYQRQDGLWIIEPGPMRFPQLSESPDDHHGFGRPRLVLTDPARVEFVARAVDVLGLSRYEVARRLHALSDGVPERAATEQAKRDLKAGREYLRRRGVLPWAAFEEPPENWWDDPRFADAINAWQRQSIDHPAPAPPPLPRQAARALASNYDVRAAIAVMPLPRAIRESRRAELERNPWRLPRGRESRFG